MKRVYLDHGATTYLNPLVFKIMKPFLLQKYGNASSLYLEGRVAKAAIEKSRENVAKILKAKPEEIFFTGSGTESDNLAILGTARANKKFGNHLITTTFEHHAVLYCFEQLEKEGFEVTYLPVDKNGLISLEQLKKSITPKTILISIMYANNEIGIIQPISRISQIIKSFHSRSSTFHFPYLHTDACQAAEYLEIDVNKLGIDLMTLNGSKIYGPKGIGMLYIKSGTKIEPIIYGGGQEKGLRPGTENVANIVGFSEALSLASLTKIKENQRLTSLRDYLIKGILTTIPKSKLNGGPINRLPNNVNVTILDVEGESLILHLDKVGISASTGSACTSASLEPSHVLQAIGLPKEICHGSLRLTLGEKTTKKDIDYVLKVLPEVVKKLRSISPVNLNF